MYWIFLVSDTLRLILSASKLKQTILVKEFFTISFSERLNRVALMVNAKKIFLIKATHCGLSISSDCAHSADSAK